MGKSILFPRFGEFFALLLTGTPMLPVKQDNPCFRSLRTLRLSLARTLTALSLRLLLTFLCVYVSMLVPAEAAPPDRIISMSPSITEILFELGVGKRVVGVTDFCKYPEEACRLPSIGGMLNPNIETWITLKPDLIILQGQSQRTLDNARNLGVATLSVQLDRLENIYQSIREIGKALDCREQADSLVARLKDHINYYQTRLQGAKRKSVLVILGDSEDPTRDLYAVGKNTFIGELLDISGGANILQDTLGRYPKISKEFIIEQSPEVIIEAGPKLRLSEKELLEKKKMWQRFSTIRAVQNNNIHLIGADYILLPGPRLGKIIDRFAHAIHPDLFPEPLETKGNGDSGQ